MINERLAPTAVIGMIIVSSQAIAAGHITSINESPDGLELSMVNGEVIRLSVDDSEEMLRQLKAAVQQVQFGIPKTR